MSILNKVLSFLVGDRPILSDLKKLVLNSIKNSLTSIVIPIWYQQVQTINKVQRLPRSIEVNFYRMKNGKPQFDESLAFPNKTEELHVATVTVQSFDGKTLIANVWSVKGFLFSIEYNTSSDYFDELLGMEPKPKVTFHCKLVAQLELPQLS
ncbi:hypothetical protein [Rheinheimera baltica]|uniref:hypothetical protein n=1 Tax=Rheinheimera baltica TaxID=67576 RepID=UPI00273E009C|nr:hypothetical protein [Rheinheimera baltica]MDP5190418.1 hypothetical protein [Rheinheimera baltica]